MSKVTIRSLRLSIVLVAMIPGTAHANEDINGKNDFPLNPTVVMILSMTKAARAIYPQSSKMAINRNRMAICGAVADNDLVERQRRLVAGNLWGRAGAQCG